MSELISLYTNLFIITITFVGILLASIIALTQLLEPLLVSKSAQRLVRSTVLILATISLCLAVMITLPGMAFLSLKSHNFIPNIDFKLNDLLTSPTYILVSVLVLSTAGILVVLFIYRVSRLLIPSNALKYLKKSNRKTIITSFFNKTGASQPMRPFQFSSIFTEDSGKKLSPEEKGKADKKAQNGYEASLRRYESDKKKLSKMENPLFPIETYLTRSIQRSNLTIVTNTLKTLEEIVSELAKDDNFKELKALVSYYQTVLLNAHELAQANGLLSISLELLESSSRISDILVENNRFEVLLIIESYWRSLASESLNSSPAIFKRAVSLLGDLGRTVLREESYDWESIQDLSDNIMRGLGWLGERLLGAGAPEKSELMLNDNETQFNAIMNAVLNIGYEMNSHRADVYPLIYFDCLYVIAKRLAQYVDIESEYDGDNGNSLFSLMYDVFCFGEAAVRKGNVRGVSLAVLRLEAHLSIADEFGYEKHKQNALESLFRLGGIVAGANLKGSADFLSGESQNIDDIIIERIAKHVGTHSLDLEAHEILVKTSTNTNIKLVSKYLYNASQALGTTFGMNLKDDDSESD
jgi:hypothetical protein